MDRDQLLAMLDIKPAPTKISKATGLVAIPHRADDAPISDTALDLDKWDLARGEQVLKNSPRLKAAKLTPLETADMFASAYLGTPEPVENCSDPRRLEYIKTLLESPEARALRTSTVYNTLASEMAANEFGDAYANLKKEDEQRQAKPSKNLARDEMKAGAALMRAVGSGVKQAAEQVDKLEEMMAALGCGVGQEGESTANLERIKKLYTNVQNDPQVRRIMELAGRYIRTAMSKQRAKTTHGYDDVVGVQLSGDISRLTPGELQALVDDDLSDDALRRIFERQAISYEYKGVEPQGRGPIVICVDESGSMSGEPVAQAKAFALSMYRVARHQRRHCVLIGFAGGRDGTVCVMPPGKHGGEDGQKLLNWLAHFHGGGTILDVPIDVLPNQIWPTLKLPKGRVDTILITDAIVNAPRAMIDNWNKWRAAEKVRCITLVIGSGRPGDLAKVSDEVYFTDRVDANNEAVQRCMSI